MTAALAFIGFALLLVALGLFRLSGGRLATKEDLNDAKQEILTALGERIDPQTLKDLTERLKSSSGSLKTVVDANQPK